MKKLLLLSGLFLSIGLFSFTDSLNIDQLEAPCSSDSDMMDMMDAPTCQGGTSICCASVNSRESR